MLSLSSAPLFPRCGLWPPPFEEENDNNIAETDYSNSFPPLPDQLPNDWYHDPFDRYAAIESRSGSQAHPIPPMATNIMMTHARKLNHNASERDRRKKVNGLYSFLRSLLPTGDQKKKVSIPGIVSRALKYIPELQNEVEGLVEKKAKILMSSSSSASCTTLEEKDIVNGVSIKRQVLTKNHHTTIGRNFATCLSSVSVALVGDRQVMIQLNNKSTTLSLSRVLEYLDLEEGGLVLLNGCSFKSFAFGDQGKHFNTLCFQVQEDHKIDTEMLKQKLLSFHYRHQTEDSFL